MRLPFRVTLWLGGRAAAISARPADFIIGGAENPYMFRWWVTPRVSWLPSIYLHRIVRSDDDRALHDHPWASCSIILSGGYTEVTPAGRFVRNAGDVTFRRASAPHRLEVARGHPCWTLFLRGPKVRDWGFLCPLGWVPWQDFVAVGDRGQVGKGCNQ